MEWTFVLLSIFLGLLPESLFFTLFIVFAKDIKQKRFVLFVLILAVNLICGALLAFSLWFHFIAIASMYAVLWILYRSHIVDVFLIAASSSILTIISAASYFSIPNLFIAALVKNAVILISVILFKKYIFKAYRVYLSIWNRKPNSKIKSITVRNISCVVLSAMFITLNFIVMHMIYRWIGG